MQFWRNTLRMGGTIQGLISDLANTTANMRTVDLETAPAFLAKLSVEEKDMRQAFTSAQNNCPTFNATTGVFTDGKCNTGATVAASNTATAMGNNITEGQQAGVLTNPGFLAHYYSNDGFRRTRLINELFACHRFPTEFASSPELVNGVVYSSPWAKNSITSADDPPTYQTRRIRPVGAVTTTAVKEYVDFSLRGGCKNCHTTMNHRTPLFATFDQVGFYSGDPMKYMVVVPVTDSPFAQFQDYLPPGEKTAWKSGVNATTFQEFGQAMANDPETMKCMMVRAWNNAYSRDDVVNDLALVPDSVIDGMSKYFAENNYNMKKALYKLYTDANFVRF